MGDVVVLGARAQAIYYHADKDVPLALQVRLHPGCARAVLGVGADAMTGRNVPLSELWGNAGRRLVAALREHRDDPRRIATAMHPALLARIAALTPREEAQVRLVRGAIAELGPPARRPMPEFRATMGVTPHAFISGQVPAPVGCSRARPTADRA